MIAAVLLVCLLATCSSKAQGVLNCPSLPVHVPTNVTDLHPNNIKVVMTLGDSITAGFGIQGAKGGLNEFRGLSWDIGGDSNATTLANFLRYYNPSIQGFSLGSHIVELCYGPLCPPFQYHPALDVLDAAQSGAMVADLVSHELDYLIKQVKANPMINLKEDWKLLTILIGANDLCASCTLVKEFLDPAEFEKHLSETLEGIRTNIPRVFVQLVEVFNLSQVYDLSLKTKACANIHRDLFIECDCIFGPDASKTRQLVDEYGQQYNARSRALAAYYQALGDPSFTVVAQPFGRNTMLKNFPTDILSTLDCFHPSLIAHQGMAIALWNNLLTPAALKKTSMNLTDTPLCPTANTKLYTY
jgi:phospholipase B1